jgi:hypothetical protein
MRNILIAVGLAVAAALLTVFYVSNYKSSVQSEGETINVSWLRVTSRSNARLAGCQREDAVRPGGAAKSDRRRTIRSRSPPHRHQPVYIGEQARSALRPIARQECALSPRAIPSHADPGQHATLLAGTSGPVTTSTWCERQVPTEDSAKHFTKIVLHDVLASRRLVRLTRRHRLST